ncbi:hypothetical protein WIW50_07665 [Flavobacteriaceae bacterium 3-367]
MVQAQLPKRTTFKKIREWVKISFKALGHLAVLVPILFLISATLSGQVKKVFITDYFQLHSDYSDSELHFDLSAHFEQPQWTSLLNDRAIALIREKFPLAEISYYGDAGFSYRFSEGVLNFDVINRKDTDYFVKIHSELAVAAGQSYRNPGPNFTNYTMLLEVRIENAKGKKIFRKTTRLPFQIRRPSHLHGLGIRLSDFESMCLDALNAAFKGQRRLEKRIVRNERNSSYAAFLSESDSFTLVHDPKGQFWLGERFVNGTYQLVDQQQKVLGSVKITGTRAQPEFTEVIGLDISDRLKQTSKLNNTISDENFTVLSGLDTDLDYEFETKNFEIPRVVVWKGKDLVGKFELLEPERFVGDYKGETYRVDLNHSIGLFQLFHQGELKGIVQFGPYLKEDKKYFDIVHFKKGMLGTDQGKLLNLYFFARMAHHIASIAAEKAREEDE